MQKENGSTGQVYNKNFQQFFQSKNYLKRSYKQMSQKLQILTTELKRARALTYYGKYPEAIEQFQKIQSGIEGQIFHIADKTLLIEWNKLLEQIKYEKNLVLTTIQMLSGKVDVRIPSRQTRENDFADNNGITGNNSSKKIGSGYAKEQELERKPKLPFGKDPFKKRMHEDDEVYNRKQKQRRREEQEEQRRAEQQNQRSNQKPSTPGQDDDQAVWDQIFPKNKPKPVAKKPSISSQPSYNKVAQNQSSVGDGKNREYEKPWMRNAKKKDDKKDEKKDGGKEERKSFLKSVYPDGNGPDSNLIESLQRQVVDMNPNITFDDIAELTKAKQILEEAVLLPLNFPELFVGNRRAWKGVLLFGPPGTGKTLLAKAVASSGATTFFNVTASSLASKWRGESQKMVRLLFQMARFYAPTTIFIDEIDSLASARGQKQDQASRKVKTELMTRIDGCTTGSEEGKLITVIGATNRPWDLDEAIRRRLEKRIYIPLPTEVGRRELLKINLKKQKIENVDLEDIVKRTQGYSGADIANLCREAAYMPMRRKLKSEGGLGKKLNDPAWKQQFTQAVNIPLTMDDFNEALKNVKPSVGQGDLKHYMDWMEEFGEQGTK